MRLKIHMRDRHRDTWDRFSIYLTIGPQHMKEIESVLIRIANPPGNKVKGKFIKSENLLNKLKGEYRRKKREEEDELFGIRRRAAAPARRKTRGRETRKGRTPVLAAYPDRPRVLKARYKGKVLRATVRKDGRISFGGKLYGSPYMAGVAAIGRKPCDGWRFWKYERSPGEWVSLSELRR